MGFEYTSFGLQSSDDVGFTENQRVAVELQATWSMVSDATPAYKNVRYPRHRRFLGYAQIMSGAYVVESIELRHANQELLFWRESSTGINESVGCYARAIASLLTPSRDLTTTTVLTRQHYTGIRFALLPGVTGNVGIRWEEFAPKCGGQVTPPSKEQGNPHAPNNSSADPSRRPANQGSDPYDPTANDGHYNPSDGFPPPPFDPAFTPTGHWYATFNGVQNRCAGDPITYPFPSLTNPDITPVWVPATQNPACPNAMDGDLLYDGVVVNNPTGVIGDINFTFF